MLGVMSLGKGLFALVSPVMFGAVIAGEPSSEPPSYHVDRGACPFECCTYGNWTATSEVPLYSAPKVRTKPVGSVPPNAEVKAVTGEVQTYAGKFQMVQRVFLKDYWDFRAGEILGVYTYLGEATYKVWHSGKFEELYIDVDPENPTPQDIGKWLSRPRSKWWVLLELPGGLRGWSDTPQKFQGTDSCG